MSEASYGEDLAIAAARTPGVDTLFGSAGETVSEPDAIGAALDRAFDAGLPYLVDVLTDPEVSYPRHTTGG